MTGPVLKLDLFRDRRAWTALRDLTDAAKHDSEVRAGPDVDAPREAWEQLGRPERVTLLVVGATGHREYVGWTVEEVEAFERAPWSPCSRKRQGLAP